MTLRAIGPRRNAAALSAACLAMALLLFVLSPLTALLSVANGLRHEDVAALRAALDWRAVRLGMKTDFGGGGLPVSLASAKVSSADDDLPGFGESFASTLVSRAVDTEITPERMMAMLSRTQAGQAGAGLAAVVRSALGRVERVTFLGPARFEAAIRMSNDPSAQPVRVSMRLEHWQWKITQIHLPEQMLQGGGSLVQSASNRT